MTGAIHVAAGVIVFTAMMLLYAIWRFYVGLNRRGVPLGFSDAVVLGGITVGLLIVMGLGVIASR